MKPKIPSKKKCLEKIPDSKSLLLMNPKTLRGVLKEIQQLIKEDSRGPRLLIPGLSVAETLLESLVDEMPEAALQPRGDASTRNETVVLVYCGDVAKLQMCDLTPGQYRAIADALEERDET